MKSCIELLVNGKAVCVAEIDEQTMATVVVSNDPYYKTSGLWPFYYWINGFQWDDAAGSLEWMKGELDPNAKIEIRIGPPSRTPDEPIKTVVVDEKECSFCHRPTSAVELMIQGDISFSRICSDCVRKFMEDIDNRTP